MQELPHRYAVSAAVQPFHDVELDARGLPSLHTETPSEFGGPGDQWSPETLLVGAVADCFALTFRGIARASKVPWTSLRCDVIGTLDRVDAMMQFTGFDIRAYLSIPPIADAQQARRVLDKAERTCLIANSLKAATHLEVSVTFDSDPVADRAFSPPAGNSSRSIHELPPEPA